MAHLSVEMTDSTLVIKSQAFCCKFKNTDENQKALFVFLRLLTCPQTGKELFTYQQIADAFGKTHATVLHAYRAIENHLDVDVQLRQDIDQISKKLGQITSCR